MSKYTRTMRDALAEMSEGFSKKEIKMAIGVASDKRYAGGNYTGAVKAIEKIKKGLSDHPQVAAVLKRQNEDIQEDGHTDVASAQNNVKVAMSALTKMSGELAKLNPEDALPSWWTNKVAVAVDKLDGMADYLDTQVEEVELDEMKEPFAVVDTADGNKVVGTASDEKGAKSIITSAELPPMKIKDKKTLKIVKVKKKQMIGYPLKEEIELDEGMFSKEYEDGQFKKGDEKPFVDAIKKGGGKNIDVQTPNRREPMLTIEFDGDVKKIKTMVSKVGDGTEEIDESIEEGRMKELHGYIDQGMSAEQIAKKMKLDVKTIKALMAGYGEDFELNEMKMNDPKLLKVFDKLKRGDKVKLKTSSTISQGKDYVEYIVKSKNTVNKGRVEKVTLATVGNEKAVKKFLYKRDGQVTFAIGDMGASIDDIKETTNNMAAYTAAITKQIGEK